MTKLLILWTFLATALFSSQSAMAENKRWRPVRPERPPVGRVTFQVVDNFRVHKFIETTNVTRVNLPNVMAIKLVARNNEVEVIEARVQLEDGREIFLDGVTGGLRQDRAVGYTFDIRRGLRIRSITLRAITRNLIGSRGELEVSVGTFR